MYGRLPRIGESVAAYAAQYPLPLMRRMAAGSALAKAHGARPMPFQKQLESCLAGVDFPFAPLQIGSDVECVPRPRHEDPEWISELCESLPFRELYRFTFRKPGHINVLECRVVKSWLKMCAKRYPDSRLVALIDSRVALGANAKGRSSSYAISRVLKTSLPYLIGGGLYPGGLHCYSANDAPSLVAGTLSPPQSRFLCGTHPFAKVTPKCSTFTWKAAVCHGWQPDGCACCFSLVGTWSETLAPRPERGPLDLGTGFAPATARRMEQCVAAFRRWVETELEILFARVCLSGQTCALALRGYGKHLYESGLPR